jgi:hypothetical protein
MTALGKTPGIYCSCGKQWHGWGWIEKADAAIRHHAKAHGLISHYQFHQRYSCQCGECRAKWETQKVSV